MEALITRLADANAPRLFNNKRKDIMYNYLFKALPTDEVNEDESIHTYGESLAYQFYCGNFSSSCEEMEANNVSVTEFIDYMEEQAEDLGYEDKLCSIFHGHFSNSFWAELAQNVKA